MVAPHFPHDSRNTPGLDSYVNNPSILDSPSLGLRMTGEEVRVLRMLVRGRYTQLAIRDPLVSRQLLHTQCSPVYRIRGCLIVLGTNHHSFSGSEISVTLVSKRLMDLQWQYAERVEESVTGWPFCICSNKSDFQPNGNVFSSCELNLYRGKLIPLTSRYWSAIPPSCVS